MRRRMLTGGGKNRNEIVAGDILCAKSGGSKAVFDAEDYDFIPSSWTPIGIVVIPPSHDVYGTGEGSAISIFYMSYENPDTGTTYDNYSSSLFPGGAGSNTYESDNTVYDIPIYYGWPTYSNFYNAPTPSVGGYLPNNGTRYFGVTSTICVLPSDASYSTDNSTPSYENDGTYYYYDRFAGDGTTIQGINPSPSPYLSNGTKNTYYSKDWVYGSTTYTNKFKDFDGKGNTNVLISAATAQSNWKTAGTITNGFGKNYAPAVCCCWRYHTVGTNQGDWYLPAIGEMGYYFARYKKINTSCGYFGGHSKTSNYRDWITLQTSSQGLRSAGGGGTICLYDNGNVGVFSRKQGYLTRAFIRF